ncbi:mucin-19 [Neovison vison]|uniref:mucin-19 n=1 Tax=Neovison vison TaxID=452646 RepID=UPI001CF00ED0|nr:mucin-19 [Neogale vison]
MTFGGTASNRNDIGRGPSGQNGYDVNAVNGLGGSKSAASETDNTNPKSRAGFSSSISGNLGFGLGASDQKGLGIGRADRSEISSRGSAGGESIGFGFDAHSPVGTGSLGWELGKQKGNAAFGFGASGSSSFGDSDINGKIKIEGKRMNSSGGPMPNDLGDTSLRNRNTFAGDSSGKSEINVEVSGQQGFGINEIGGTRMRGSGSAGAGFKGFGSDAGSSGEDTWSSGSGSGEGRKGTAGLGGVASGPNEFGETGRGGTGEATTWGKGIYKAFNGRIFSFESSCSYTFCHHCVESGGDFNIEIKRKSNGDFEKIAVEIDNNEVSVSGDRILVNEERVQIPYDNKLIHIKKYGEHYVLKSRRGILSLMWGKNKLSLTLHKQYPTCGLCGNFNSTPGDNINEHIASSKIPGDCPKAFSKSYEICEDGVEYCDKIIGTYFEKCRKVAAFSDDYRMICVNDYCQNPGKNSTCDTYSELSRLCASDGPGIYESWRDDSDVTCGKPRCPEKHIYKECGPSNPATCSNVAPFQDSECVNGCFCPEGYLLDDIGEKGGCVLKTECPCSLHGKTYKSGEVRRGPCGSQCTCQNAKWSCTEALCPGRCKVEGNSVTTFDGIKYYHPGNCHFLAIHHKDWSVSVELRPCPSGQSGTCLNSVTLLLNSPISGNKYVFSRNGTITNNGIEYTNESYDDSVYVFKASSSYLQVETNFGVKMQIQIAPAMQLYVSVPPNSFTDTVGLCGSFNNRVEDDLMSSQNILEKTPQAFADSWEMMPCPKGKPTSCISIEKEKFAEKHCGIFLDSDGPFASCHPVVNAKPYYEECKRYTCTCENSEDCLCTVFGNYVKACAEKEVYMVGWRTGLCDSSCPSDLVFKYNIKACNKTCRLLSERYRSCDIEDVPFDGCTCPDGMYQNNEGNCVPKSQCDCFLNGKVIQPGKLININNNRCVCRDGNFLCQTPISSAQQNCSGGAEYVDCRGPRARRRVDSKCGAWNMPGFDENLPCKAGCYCPVGMVRNSKGNCVFPEDCPCSFGGGEYEQGSVTSVGCNNCTCVKGSWSCTQNKCQTVCHIYGEGHVRTFDGKSYSFDGLCQYSFAEDYCGRESGTFRILTESVPCCENGLTCSRKIIVAFQDQNVVLHDGKVTASKITESKDCGLTENTYSVHTVGLYLILKFLNGITIIWDKNTRVSAILDPRWHGKVCGLCGNNNGDLKDDFITRHSSEAIGALEFGNSWKTSQKCADTAAQYFPCDSNPYCKAWAVQKCGIIRDSIFKECHHKVDPEAYLEACIEEACSCDMEGKYLGFCTAVAMYAEACSAVGVCVTWRKPDLCPVFCDYYNGPGECSWRYEPCGTVTTKTCRDRVIGQKFSAVLEGCYAKCPDNAPYLDENLMKCVRLSECSCFYNDIVPAGGVIQDDCGRTCYCIAGELECNGDASSANSTFTAITSVTSSSGSAASTPVLTRASSETIGGTGSPTAAARGGTPEGTEGFTTAAGSEKTSGDSAVPGTTLGDRAGTARGLPTERSTTGVAGRPVSTTLNAGSLGSTGAGPAFTSSPGHTPGGTGSPNAAARGGTPEGTEGFTTAAGSEKTSGDSAVPGTTLGDRAGTARGLPTERSTTGVAGRPVSTTLNAGSLGSTGAGPAFTSSPGHTPGGTGSPTAAARGGTPEGTEGFTTAAGSEKTSGDSAVPGTTLGDRAGTARGLPTERSTTGVAGRPVSTTLNAGSLGSTGAGPAFTSSPGHTPGGTGSPTAAARGGTPEGTEGFTTAAGSEKTSGDSAVPGTTLGDRAGTARGLPTERSTTGVAGRPVSTTLNAGSLGSTGAGPAFTSSPGHTPGGTGSPNAAARGGTPEGTEGFTTAAGSEKTSGDSAVPGTTLGDRAGTARGLPTERSTTGVAGRPVSTTLNAGSLGSTGAGPAFTSSPGHTPGGTGSPTAAARGGTPEGTEGFTTAAGSEKTSGDSAGPGTTLGDRAGTARGLPTERSTTGVAGRPVSTTLNAGSLGSTGAGPAFTSSPGHTPGGTGSPTAAARGGTPEGTEGFTTAAGSEKTSGDSAGPGTTLGDRAGTARGLPTERSTTGVAGRPVSTTLNAGSLGSTGAGPAFTSSPGHTPGGTGSPTAAARGGTPEGTEGFTTAAGSEKTSGDSAGPGTTLGDRAGTARGLPTERSTTGVAGRPVSTTLNAGSLGSTGAGPAFTSSPGHTPGGTGSPTAAARGGTPEGTEGFTTAAGSEKTSGDSAGPGTTLGDRAGTARGLPTERSTTGVAGRPVSTTLNAGSLGSTGAGPAFTSSPGHTPGGTGSPTAAARGGTPEGTEGFTTAAGSEKTSGDSAVPGTTLGDRAGTARGLPTERSTTGVAGRPVSTTLNAGSLGSTGAGPAFTSSPGHTPGGTGSPTAAARGGTPEGTEGFTTAAGSEKTSGDSAGPGTTLGDRAGTARGLPTERSTTGVAGRPVSTTLNAGSLGSTGAGPAFTSSPGHTPGGTGSPTAAARGGTPEGTEGFTTAAGSEKTSGDSAGPGTTLGDRAGTARGLPTERSTTGVAGRPVSTTLNAGSLGSTGAGPAFTSSPGHTPGGTGSPTAAARGGTPEGTEGFTTAAGSEKTSGDSAGPGTTLGDRAGTARGLPTERSTTGVAGRPVSTTLNAGSLGSTGAGPAFTSSPGHTPGGTGSPTAAARGGTPEGTEGFTTAAGSEKTSGDSAGPGTTLGDRAGTARGLPTERSTTGVAGRPVSTTLNAGSLGSTGAGPAFTSSPGHTPGGTGSPTAAARGGTPEGTEGFTTAAGSEKTSGDSAGPGTTLGDRAGTARGLPTERSTTGVAGRPVSTTLNAGSLGSTGAGPAFTSSPGHTPGGTGSPTAAARGGTPEGTEGFTTATGSEKTSGDSAGPGTTLGDRAGTARGLPTERSSTGVAGRPVSTTLNAGSLGSTGAGPAFTSSPGHTPGGTGSPTAAARGGTPEGTEGFTTAAGSEKTSGDSAGPGTTLGDRAGTARGLPTERSSTGVAGRPVSTTLNAGSLGSTGAGPAFTSSPGHTPGGTGSPTAAARGGTPEGTEGFTTAAGSEKTSGDSAGPGTTLGDRAGGTGSPTAAARGGTPEGTEGFTTAAGSEKTSGDSAGPGTTLGDRAGAVDRGFAATFVAVGETTSVAPGTSREAFETTTASGISTTVTASTEVKETSETKMQTRCPPSHPPPPVCHGPLGEKKSPGEEWTANCYTCTCTDANTVDCSLKECPSAPTCKTGERLVKFQDNDTCCEIGYCEPRTCLFNSIDYEIGASFDDPSNPCISYSCHNTGFVAVVQDCPKQTWCPEEDRVYDSKKCCYTCKTNCRSAPVNVTIKYNGCQKRVQMARCVGECKKTVRYNYTLFKLTNSCLCCREDNYEFREVVLSCPDGSTIPYRYRHVTTCSCSDICQQSVTPAVS